MAAGGRGAAEAGRVRRSGPPDLNDRGHVIFALHVALAATTFLVVLNGFLQGVKKSQIDAFLSLLLVALLVVGFVAFGWKAGLLALGLCFLYAGVSRPLAARTAARLLSFGGGPSGKHIGLPARQLERISRELGRETNPQQMMREILSGSTRHDEARQALLQYVEANQETATVLSEFGATRSTLDELYSTLSAAGAGQWAGGHFVSASALA